MLIHYVYYWHIQNTSGAVQRTCLAANRPGRALALILATRYRGPQREAAHPRDRRLRPRHDREPLSLVPWIAEAYLRAGLVRWFLTWRKAKHHDLFGTAARVDVPALVLVGARDPVVPVRFARSVAHALPDARFLVIPRAAHAVIFDAAERFNAAILEFLRETGHPLGSHRDTEAQR
jgi:pimeloyl-ACP methyl ester carboxylesterase